MRKHPRRSPLSNCRLFLLGWIRPKFPGGSKASALQSRRSLSGGSIDPKANTLGGHTDRMSWPVWSSCDGVGPTTRPDFSMSLWPTFRPGEMTWCPGTLLPRPSIGGFRLCRDFSSFWEVSRASSGCQSQSRIPLTPSSSRENPPIQSRKPKP